MTEDEAKKKWCPHGRVRGVKLAGYNRLPNGRKSNNSLCIGSACMAWRLVPEEHVGFCGLAGKL